MPFSLINPFRPAFELDSSTLILENRHPLVITDPYFLVPSHNVVTTLPYPPRLRQPSRHRPRRFRSVVSYRRYSPSRVLSLPRLKTLDHPHPISPNLCNPLLPSRSQPIYLRPFVPTTLIVCNIIRCLTSRRVPLVRVLAETA